MNYYKKTLSLILVFLLFFPSFVLAIDNTTNINSANGQNYIQTYQYDPIGNITYKSDQGAYQYNGNQNTSYANPHAVTNIQPINSIYEGTESFTDWDNAVRYVNGGSAITNSTDTAHTGTISLKASGSLYNGARLIKTNLTVGQTVTFTGYLKATADNGNPLYIRANGTEQNDWNQTQLLPNGAWQQFSLTGIINYTSVDFNVFQINSTTPFYLDDIKIFYGQPSDNPTTKTFTYDHNGNLITDGTWTHTWDYNNRLISSTNGTKTVTYAYDSSGNRVSKSDGSNTTYYINQYYDIENGTVKKHIFAGNEKVATIENTNTYYHHTDHLTGSNVDTDGVGSIVESIDYFPFGGVRVDSKTAGYENDYKYTGKELDTDTGLYYYGARYYSSEIGRFISVDPMVSVLSLKFLINPQQLNSYSYVTNNPLIYTDPTGKDLKSAFVGVFSFIGAAAYEFTDSMSYDLLPNINYGNANNATIAGGQAGNNLAQYINAGEMAIGAATIASSGPTMALAPVTGGTSSLVAGAEVAVDGALVAHGSGNLMKAIGKGGEIKNNSTGKNQPSRSNNPNKSESEAWKNLDPHKDGWKKSGTGNDTKYYRWDYTHNDIEIYNKNGKHQGSLDPTTGKQYREAQPTHNISKNKIP